VKKEKLRSGYSTGACAAAAAKAAAILLLGTEAWKCESVKAEDFLTSTLPRFNRLRVLIQRSNRFGNFRRRALALHATRREDDFQSGIAALDAAIVRAVTVRKAINEDEIHHVVRPV
jgi:hypothetical protein